MIRYIVYALLLCTVISELDASCCAGRRSGTYIGFLGGGSFLNLVTTDKVQYLDEKAGYLAGVAIGYRLPWALRLEGEYTCRTNSFDLKLVNQNTSSINNQNTGGFTLTGNGARITVNTYMANLYVEGKLNCAIRPYVGVGSGYAQVIAKHKASKLSLINSEERTCYQVIGGAGFPIFRCFELAFEYRYMHAQYNTHHHAILANLRYFSF